MQAGRRLLETFSLLASDVLFSRDVSASPVLLREMDGEAGGGGEAVTQEDPVCRSITATQGICVDEAGSLFQQWRMTQKVSGKLQIVKWFRVQAGHT